MDSNSQDDLLLHSQNAAQAQASIVYCPSCGASVALPVVPPSNAGLFCDICTSPNLLVSTNEGVDWNPLSDAFNALSINSDTDTAQLPIATEPQQNVGLEAQAEAITPTIQEEMKRRSLILSELMNFREALHHVRHQPELDTQPEPQPTLHEAGEFGESSGGNSGMAMDGDYAGDDGMSDMQRAFHQLLDFRQQQNGMYAMDGQMTDQDLMNMGYMPTHYDGYTQQLSREEEEGMYDDPPIEYVNAHPPVQEDPSGANWQHLNSEPHSQPQTSNANDDDYDDEGQIYATPQQRDEMRARMKELRMNPEMREREMLCKKYSVGRLGIANNT
ncbi:hypothetical protein TWF694_003168 [Orbilia ellipsospora]|uniref:Uncharacterized protein n=1 Tax=Orbilia ellipsospora TaxID=2528407 RepID=A0AAV9X0P7_9PEZI